MNIIKSTIQLSIGAAFGIGMVLSCGDSSPHSVDARDASACDCPVSEAPIAGRLIIVESPVVTIPANAQGQPGVFCPSSTQFISGTCIGTEHSRFEDVTLQQFGFDKTTFSWFCVFKNNELTPVEVKATVLCLRPAI